MFSSRRRKKKKNIIDCLQLIIKDAFSQEEYGSATCIPPDVLSPPFQVQWTSNGRVITDISELVPDASGLCVTRVSPGGISVTVTDRTGETMSANAIVGVIDLPVIVNYECKHASHSLARDGSITAIIERQPAQCKYLWSNGVVTNTPFLQYASVGTYMVSCIHADVSKVLSYIHACSPAIVSSEPLME